MDSDTAVEYLTDAMRAAGFSSARRFASELFGVDERTMRRWQAGDTTPPMSVLIICAAIINRPALAKELLRAHEGLVERR